MKEQLQVIAQLGQFQTAVLEAGHFYGDSRLTERDHQGIVVGNTTTNILREMGIVVATCLLVDDFHEGDNAISGNLSVMEKIGFSPEIIYRENEFQTQAMTIFENLRIAGNVIRHEGKGTWNLRHKKKPQLLSSDGAPSCSLLDAAVYQKKYEQFGGICVTVLPTHDDERDYIRQQRYTKEILKSAGVYVPILNIFYDDKGDITVDFDY